MIWYNKSLTVSGQPQDATVRLVGSYAPPEGLESAIKISLETREGNIILYEHTPSGLAYEEPTAEDILLRYSGKIIKAKQKIESTPYHELMSLKRIR